MPNPGKIIPTMGMDIVWRKLSVNMTNHKLINYLLLYPAWIFNNAKPNEIPNKVIPKQTVAVDIISLIIFLIFNSF